MFILYIFILPFCLLHLLCRTAQLLFFPEQLDQQPRGEMDLQQLLGEYFCSSLCLDARYKFQDGTSHLPNPKINNNHLFYFYFIFSLFLTNLLFYIHHRRLQEQQTA